MDVLSKSQRSFCMSRIRGKNTKPELLLRKSLWNLGFRYRLHYKLPGKPDITFLRPRVAVFVDGCFWHGCPEHGVQPKTNTAFWVNKIQKNIERDKLNSIILERDGWTVLRFWEHDVIKNINSVLDTIKDVVTHKKMQS